MTTDTKPEHVRYKDVGCDLHPACLTCPLPVCKEELSHGSRAVRARMRGLQVALLVDEGHSVRWIAQTLGITPRSVYKSMALGKDWESSELNSLTDSSSRAKISIAAHSVSTNGGDHAR